MLARIDQCPNFDAQRIPCRPDVAQRLRAVVVRPGEGEVGRRGGQVTADVKVCRGVHLAHARFRTLGGEGIREINNIATFVERP